MGLSMGERKAVTRELVARYRRASKKGKGGLILTELCELTGWHRDHARRALRAVADRPVARRERLGWCPARRARSPLYDEDVMEPLRFVWAVLDFPCGKRLAPAMPSMVESLERPRARGRAVGARRLAVHLGCHHRPAAGT